MFFLLAAALVPPASVTDLMTGVAAKGPGAGRDGRTAGTVVAQSDAHREHAR
jgi:hypothetical protein